MVKSAPCPECGRMLGIDHNVSPIKHLVYCMHVQYEPIAAIRGRHAAAAAGGDIRARRIVALLELEEAEA